MDVVLEPVWVASAAWQAGPGRLHHAAVQLEHRDKSLRYTRTVRISCAWQDEQRDLAETIRVSGSILLSTVSNFLDFFKMETGKTLDIVRAEINPRVRRP